TLWRIRNRPGVTRGERLPATLRNVEMANLLAQDRYRPRRYPGRVTLFRATQQPLGSPEDPQLGWGGLAEGGCEVHDIPGDHMEITEEPQVRSLAERLRACLRKAHEAASVR